MDKKKIQENLSQAFDILSQIPVAEENVDRMFYAKEKLREVWQMLEAPETKAKGQ